MHILFVWPYWHYPKVALEFLEKVRKKGHNVSVLLGDFEGKFDPKRFDVDIDFHFASKWDVLSRLTGTPYPVFRRISRHLESVRPDIVHINSHLFLSNYQAARAARSLGIPFVVTVHGVVAKRSLVLDTLQGIYFRTLAKSMFDMAASVICLTENDAAVVSGMMGGYNRISIIPNGVDTELFRPSAGKASDLVVWVGRLVPEKGLAYLLKAMPEIVRERPHVRLVLVGGGILKGELMRLADELGLRDRVSFLGTLGRVEVAKALSRASVFAFPSLREGLPFSVLEAMACGVPVIGSNISGISDVVTHGQNGLLVPPQKVEALANAISTLLNDEGLRRRLGQNARQLMIEKYSWTTNIDKIEKVYSEAIQD